MTQLMPHLPPPPTIGWTVVVIAAAVAAGWDIVTGRIPNWLTASLFVAGLIAAGVAGGAWGVAGSLMAALLLLVPFFVLFALAGGGAGDAKLMAGIGAWLGVTDGLLALLAIVIMGGLLAVLIAACRRRLVTALMNAGLIAWIVRHDPATLTGSSTQHMLPGVEQTHPMPYGPAIFLGAAICAFMRWWLWQG